MIVVVALVVGVVVGCASSGGGTRIDNIPMYGQPEVDVPDPVIDLFKAYVFARADNKYIDPTGNREQIYFRRAVRGLWMGT